MDNISNRAVYECSGQRVCWIRGAFFIGFVSQTCTTIPGCPEPPGCNSWLPPVKLFTYLIYLYITHIYMCIYVTLRTSQMTEPADKFAIAANKSWLTKGSLSSLGSHPTGGEAGGEIRNCLVNAGGWRCWSSTSKKYIKYIILKIDKAKVNNSCKCKKHYCTNLSE